MLIAEFSDKANKLVRHCEIVDDFTYLHDQWTAVATDSGTHAIADTKGGKRDLKPSDGTVADNDEIYLHTSECFIFDATDAISFDALINFAQANTDDANLFIGLMSAVAANSIQDDGAGPAADFYGAGFYAIDGNANWHVILSVGTTQYTAELNATNSIDGTAHAAGSASQQRLSIEVRPRGSGDIDVTFSIDGTNVYNFTGKDNGTPTEMSVVFGAKNGDTNLETLSPDYVRCSQPR